MQKKKSLTVALYIFGYSLLGWLCVEIYFQQRFWHGVVSQFDPELGWTVIPNQSLSYNGKTYTTNSLGFRSGAVDFSKKHVIVSGDSVAWGDGVNDNETTAAFLDDKFTNYQTLNLGVNGFGTDQSYLRLKRHISKLNPQLIVFMVYSGNDLWDTSNDTRYGKSKPLFTLKKEQTEPFGYKVKISSNDIHLSNKRISRFSCSNLFSRSWLFSLAAFKSFRKFFCNERTLKDGEHIYVFVSLLLKIKDLANANNSKILFPLLPSKSDFIFSNQETSTYKKGFIILRDIFTQLKLPHIDFYKRVKEEKLNIEGLYNPNDNAHLSPIGNRLLAEMVYDYWNLNIKNEKTKGGADK